MLSLVSYQKTLKHVIFACSSRRLNRQIGYKKIGKRDLNVSYQLSALSRQPAASVKGFSKNFLLAFFYFRNASAKIRSSE